MEAASPNERAVMKAAFLYGPEDVRVEDAAAPRLIESTDAIVRITASCVCGSDLHPYRKAPHFEHGRAMGHEFIGIVEATGTDVASVRPGDAVIAPFMWSDGTCDYCRAGLQTSCRHGGGWGARDIGGGQAEVIRVPQADGTLFVVPGGWDASLVPSLLTLSDVYGTGFHAARTARVAPGQTVAVVGDGAVGLLAVLSAARLGADRIILLGRHTARTDLGVRFGATDVVAERGDAAIARVRELTGGDGVDAVLEAVGYLDAFETALGVVRPGGVISRVGVPQYVEAPVGRNELFMPNVTLTGGVAPVRAYMAELLPDVLDGTVEPGLVFDRELPLDEAPEAYRLMNEREALKVLLRP